MTEFNQLINKTGFSTEQLDLLAYLLAEEGIELEQASKISPRENPATAPLSFPQARLWFLDQLQPGSDVYNIPVVVSIAGRLNVTALEQSLNEIVQRHEALRTTFTTVDRQPVQIIHSNQNLTVPIINLEAYSQSDRQTQYLQLAAQEAKQPFDLSQFPLLRAKVIRLSDEEHILLLTMHHIVSDGWSLGVLVRELAAFYDALSNHQPVPLSPLSIQYADYAIWQKQRLQGDLLETQLNYWKQQLAGSLPVLQLPTDRPRSPVQTFCGARQKLQLSKSLSQAIADLSQQAGVTPFITLLTAFKILLYRYTGQADMIVGSPVANRNQVETEDLIGFFINTVVLRTNLAGNPRFQELLASVRDVVLGAYNHQELPFEKVVETLRPERDMSQTPLFQVMFALQNAPMPALEFSGLQLTPLEIDHGTAKFDLTLDLEETPYGIKGWLEYNTDLFDPETIQRMAGHFQTLLAGIIANPEQHLSDLPLLTVPEKHQILEQWNSTQTEYPQDKSIHQLFEAQVEKTPDANALIFQDKQLTYRQLNQRANQLAHYLQKLGVQPEVRVGICVERSEELVVGLLGILKAGGAYIPLDPKYPQERLAFMLQDAQAPVLLTQKQLLDQLTGHSAQVVCLDSDWETISQESAENPQVPVLPENNAYVLYTSGSTGQPKAVVIEHHSAVAFLDWATKVFSAEDFAGVLAATSICFDLSVFELFATLSCGGQVILVENALALPSLPALTSVTLINTVPSAIAELLRVNGIPASVRTINLAGEPLPQKLVKQLYQQTNVQQVFNLYGPSEDTTYSTFTLVKLEDQIVTIGRPITNTQVYVLDPYLQPVPIGVPGELYIGGCGLARGYLNQPELSAQKFIQNPFRRNRGAGEQGSRGAGEKLQQSFPSVPHPLCSSASSERLYKTGDLVRYLPDGNLEYLGRLDHQVKIRGFRIELGEIEALLRQYPGVRDVVVMAREDRPGEKRLVAYLAAAAAEIPVKTLRSFLGEKLPEFMIPASFVILDTLPLTPNGKVDRRSLPIPEVTCWESESEYVAPRTLVEELLTAIWSEILGLEKVGIKDNFFALGGHSLLATQVVSRVREALQVELPLRSFFAAPTVADLAEEIAQIPYEATDVKALPILPVSRDCDLPLSFAQTRLWFLNQLDTFTTAYNITEAVQMTGSLNVAALYQSLNEVVRRHESLRTTFETVEGQPSQVIHPSLTLSLPIVDLSELSTVKQQPEIQQLVNQEIKEPFDLIQGPLLRVKLLQLGETEHLLLLSMHHIISDGWSMGVLIREMAALYEAYSTDKPSPLPELCVQYADFAVWQRQWLQGEVLEQQLVYWSEQLTGSSRLYLPTDRQRPAVQTFIGNKQAVELPKALLDKLQALSQREGVTLFMTLLAAFKVLLYRYSQQDDIIVGSPIANRNRKETEPLIGMFVNTLVLRTDLGGNPSFSELLQRVREVTLGAYAHQDLPFEKLVEVVQSERDTSRNPLFQVMFVVQNASIPALELMGLTLQSMPIDHETAMFDLTLSLEETPNGINGFWEYNTDLFDAATIDRMAAHFQTLLEGIVANSREQIINLPLLRGSERQQLLVDWNNRKTSVLKDRCIHQLFESQVEVTPNAIAVCLENESFSYQQLNCRANELAHYLLAQGVQPETRVGICLERSLDLLVGMLGILKAGGAYVPLDPTYPSDRLALMLEDAQVPVLLTQERLLTSLPESKAKVVCLDADWQAIAEYSQENPNTQVTADNLAYIIYTSGSTGRPKGVAIQHRSLVSYTNTASQAYKIEADDRILQFASISFDTSAEEIYPCLTRGATLVLRTDKMLASVSTFLETCQNWGINILNLPTSYWHELAANLETSTTNFPSSVRLVIIGGERAIPERLAKWHNSVGQVVSLINTYGPTESTIVATMGELKDTADSELTIGHAIPNVQTYVLDESLQPVPIGVRGELYIGGAGLARGYLNRPDLTAEKFIPNPFSLEPGARLYKTGDLVRYRVNRTIEFLGRIDDQVKIRGFRIELSEIELALLQYPSVGEVVLQAREDIPGDRRLVAYVVPQSGQKPSISDLRGFLQERLPNFMLPSAFVLLEALPVLPNGKLNRRSLPAPEQLQTELAATYVAPRTELERTIANIWQEVLQVEKVGLHNNFFDLGGHSLLMIQVHERLRKTLNQDVSMIEMFKYSTVSLLAKHLSLDNGDATFGLQPSHNLEDMRAGRNRLKQRLARSSVINPQK
ncbi:amino acid adenylation domain-containing protein [Nostoc punctiforme UO1]|uniref:amino acid adenylation domain-containing protein n=1 Tax=Nostoc punctiforme TaxID=272131 RepID=UPI0030A0A12E